MKLTRDYDRHVEIDILGCELYGLLIRIDEREQIGYVIVPVVVCDQVIDQQFIGVPVSNIHPIGEGAIAIMMDGRR